MYNHLLDTFRVVAETGSFSKAAEKLYLSPTAVMKQMNLLEKQLELPLLERTSQGIRLTDCGSSLLADACQIMELSAQAIQRARRLRDRETDVIRVGSSMLNPCRAFMDIWFQHTLPGCRIEIIPFEDDHRGIRGVIESIGERFDFLVGVCDSRQWLSGRGFTQLGAYRKCIAVPVGHPLSGRQRLRLEDLHGFTLMMIPQGDSPVNDAIREELQQNHPQITILDTARNYDIGVYNRAQEKGCLLLNNECWAQVHPSFTTVAVEWEYTIPYGLLYAQNPSPPAKAFLKILCGSEK